MKLLLALWILAVVTKEVHPSTLVRLPRHAVSKPTSSVHTEYEATYEQKGRRGNGSYSTVSGKQEVVHNNCGDNWNAFADKCASLIKDLVASLANAVSSKPGDATNLQLRIKNTLTHFDSTDNCTCLNHTKNLSGMDLSSLFDNITISTVQPASTNGNNLIAPTQQPDGDSGDNAQNGAPETAPPAVTQPNLASANTQHVDPALAHGADEPSNGNSRRGAQYPQPARAASRLPADSATAGSAPPASPSYPSRVTQRPVFPPETPTEDVLTPQPKTSGTSSQPGQRTPARNAVDLPERNNNIQRAGTQLKPATAPSSASQVSSPQRSAFGSPNNAEPEEAVVVPVKPVRNSVPNSGGSSGTGSAGRVSPTAGRVNGAVAEPLTSSAGSPVSNGVSNTPVVLTPESEDEDESRVTPSDSADETSGRTSGRHTTPVFTPVESDSRVTSSDSEDESPAGEGSGAVPTGGSNNGAAGEPLASSGGSSDTVPAVITEETQTTPSDREDESPEEHTRDYSRTTVGVLTAGGSGNGGLSESRTTTSDDSDNEDSHSGSTPIPIVNSDDSTPEKLSGGDEGNGLRPTGDAQPATSLQDPAGKVSDGEDIPVIGPSEDATTSSPLSSDSERPGEAQVLEPGQVQSASPEDAAPKVNSGSLTDRPQGGQRLSPEKVPPINSRSNLPEPSTAVDNASTLRPSPVYVPFPTTPSPIPSSNHNLRPTGSEQGATSGPPTAADDADEGSASPAVNRGSQSPGRVPASKGGRKPNDNIFIVTPTPVYADKTNQEIEPENHVTAADFEGTTVGGGTSNGGSQTSVGRGTTANAGGVATDSGDGQQGMLLTTPAQEIIPVTPIPAQNAGDQTEPLNPRAPVVQPTRSQQNPQPGTAAAQPVTTAPEDTDLTKPTTFQTTSTDPTPPQASAPQDSDETLHHAPATPPKTPPSKHSDDDDDEDCCSCESCTEEEVTNPKQYKEIACKDLEEARRELKAIFDKITKKLKCGRKAPQKIVAS